MPEDNALAPVLILGVGNILFTDEGIGVRAVRHLRDQATLPPGVELLDGGTLGSRLMDAIMACRRLIVLDAVLGGGAPGALYRLEGEGVRKSLSFRDSMHQTDLADTLVYCELLGNRPETVVFGMEPADYRSMGTELSPVCAARIPDLAECALREAAAVLISRAL